MKLNYLILTVISLSLTACTNTGLDYDAAGTFEADEIIISSEANGKLLSFDIEEGMQLDSGLQVGSIDSTQLYFTRNQILQSRNAVISSKPNIEKQLAATKREIAKLEQDRKRYENLVKGNAATQKQLDDINTNLQILQSRLAAQQNTLHATTSSLNEQGNSLDAQLANIENQLSKCKLVNPVNGTVLVKYAMKDEMTAIGKPLYKIADLSTLILRAYVTADQFGKIKLGEKVKVYVDAEEGKYKEYSGTITWISDKAEFTPKTIQTKSERANLVYAVKIKVVNDGYLKLGMYAEVALNDH